MISKAEWEVMRVVWAHDGITSKEVYNCLQAKNEWKATTVKTMLGRMVKKGVLKVNQQQNKYIYIANISEHDYDLKVLKEVLARICNKNKPQLIAELISSISLTEADKQMLQQVLAEHKVIESVPCQCSKGQCRCAKDI